MLDTIVAGTRRALEFAAQPARKKFLLDQLRRGLWPAAAGPVAHCRGLRRGAGRCQPALRLWRRETAERTALRDSCAPARAGDEDRALLRVRRALSAVGRALCHRQFHPRRPGRRPIEVNGDGTPYRSYLYAADLAIWLWTILFRGASNRPYNVGSRERVDHRRDLPGLSAGSFPAKCRLRLRGGPRPAARGAVRSRDARAEKELGLREWVPLDEAIRRTAQWHKNQSL